MTRNIGIMAILLLLFPAPISAESGKGLETGGLREILLMLEPLDDKAGAIGINNKLIRSKIELRLKKHGLKFLDESVPPGFLYVQITVTKSAYGINVVFNRNVTYKVADRTYNAPGDMWNEGVIGTHLGDRNAIISSLMDLIDFFIADYLRANNL